MKRWKRWALVGATTATLLGLGAGLAGTAPVLAWAAERTGWHCEALEGSLWTGLRAARVRHQSPGLRVELDDLQLDPIRWHQGALHTALSAQRLHWEAAPSSAPPPTLAELLNALDWPVALRLSRVQVQALSLQGQSLQKLDAELQVGGHPQALALTLHSLRWDAGQLQAQGRALLTRDGALDAALQLRTPQAHLSAEGRGPLSRWPLTARLSSPDSGQAQLQATLQPLAPQPFLALKTQFEQLDLQALHPQAPRSRWQGEAELLPQPGGELQLSLDATNALALRRDEGGWPLRAVALQVQAHPAHWERLRVNALRVQLGNARQSAGELSLAAPAALPQAGQALALRVQLQGLQLPRLDAGWPALQVSGQASATQAATAGPSVDAPLALQLNLAAQALQDNARDQAWRVDADARLAQQTLTVQRLLLQQTHGPGRVEAQGQWTQQPTGWQAQAQAQVQQWPQQLGPWPALLNAQAEARLGLSGAHWQGQIDVRVNEGSRLATLPLQGRLSWQGDAEARRWTAALELPHAQGADALSATGEAPALRAADGPGGLAQAQAWQPRTLAWRMADLARLRPVWQPWLKQLGGASEGRIALDGDALPLSVQARWQDGRLQQRTDTASLRWAGAALNLEAGLARWQLRGVESQGWVLREAEGEGGMARPWRWWAEGQAPGTWAGEPLPRWRWEGEADAPLREGDAWRLGRLNTRLRPPGEAPWLDWAGSQLQWWPRGQALRWDGGRMSLRQDTLARQSLGLRWQAGSPEVDLQLEGALHPVPWLAALQPDAGWQGDLLTDLALQVRGASVDVRLRRSQGDLRFDGQALQLERLSADLQHRPQGETRLQLGLSSPVLGSLDARAQAQAPGGALTGTVQARLPALHLLQPWLPGGLQLRGQATVDAAVAGTLDSPQLRGQGDVRIERLQHAASGLGGQQGRMSWRFDEQRLTVSTLELQGLGDGDSGGWLRGQGEWGWGAAQSSAKLNLRADTFRLLNRFDRQLITSGDVAVVLDGRRLQLRGKVKADQGVFDISQGDAPSLDDDVSVNRPSVAAAPKASAANPWQRDVQLQFDLGQRLRIQGRGLASRLTGQLQVVDQGGKPAQWTGLLEMGGGRYKAYGQTLDIESGELRFTGALDNPRLDILALRPDLEVRVGVSATGSAQTPRIRLYSEPDMPDNDKLAWLLLGRAPDELGRNDSALLQRAALALLSGEGGNPAAQLMDRIGLSEFSINNSEDAGTTLRLGAQLSRRWSVGYERSLNAATGSWQLVYRLGQRFRLRAQSGTDSALDALWLWRFD